MAEKKPSLTVLGGALAGTRFVLEGLGPEVLLGADPSCQLQLALAGVSAQHARLRVEPQGYTIEDAGSEHGLHVNDSRVVEATQLRNGDIVWLGTPGEADVVMLQCILPSRPVAAAEPEPASAPAAPHSSLSEDETLALALEQEGARGEAAAAAEEEPATGFYTAEDAASAEAPFAAEAPPAPFSAESPELVVAEDAPAEAASVPFGVDSAPVEASPTPSFEDDTREQTYEFGEDPSTVVMASEMEAPPPPYIPEPELPATFVLPAEPEPTVALPPPPPPPAEPPPKAQVVDRPVRAPAAAAAAPPPVAPRTPRQAPPPSSPAASIPGRRAARPAPPPPGAGPSSKTGLYAGIGIGVLALVGVGLFAVRKFRSGPPPVTVAEAPPATAPQPTSPPETLAEAPPAEAPPPVEAEPEVTPPPAAVPTPLAPTPAAATPPPAAVPTPLAPTPAAATPPPTTLKAAPSPSPAAKKSTPTPPPATTPTGPSPEQLRAQQVAALLGQAESALAGGQYDQAIGHFDEVLRLDPGNGRATGDRATAVSLRDAARKTFVAGRTVIKTDKAAGGGLAGFEGAAVQKTPDFSGRIEFEMSPASGLKPGDAWTLRVYLVNDGKKAIKVGGVTANTVLNGAGAGGPVAAGSKEVAPQQRGLVGTVNGSWREETSSWVAEVLVTANKGDTLKNTLTWR